MRSAVLIIPSAYQSAGNAVGEAMGWGPGVYSIPLYTGDALTHYGLRSDVSDDFLHIINVASGQAPMPSPEPEWAGMFSDVDPESLSAVLAAVILDVSPDPLDPEKPALWGSEHLNAVVKGLGLARETSE